MQPILKIDLTHRRVNRVEIPLDWEREYLGGASLAARLLYEKLTPELEPLGDDAPLLFLNGPLSGTAGPTVGRFVICGRSPATRLWAESNCGGFWGPELRMAGFDGVWIEGRAEQPVFLWIQDDRVEIREAGAIWGLDCYQSIEAIEKELKAGKVRVACIGPAGEALIPFALILCDHGRVAGRTGLGAVMGSKNLKAIAVQGHGKVPVIDWQSYLPLRSEANRILRSDNQSMVLRELGTASSAEYFDYLGEMPKKYYQNGTFHEDLKISGSEIKDTILAGVSACHACVIACGRVVRLSDGQKRKGPEYETLVGFGPNLGLNDPVLATTLGEQCDRYGMDTISMSNTLGLAYQLFENGKLTLQDTGGLELNWGDGSFLANLLELTVQRQGFGALLAQGSRALGRHFDAEDEAVQVNGLEVAYHDPRGASGMALAYATSPRGACHNQSDYFFIDVWKTEPSIGIVSNERLGGAEKAPNVARHQDWRTVCNSLVLCIFANLEPDLILPLVNSACGVEFSLAELLQTGERGWNLKRAINNRLGLTRASDKLPNALLQPYQDATEENPFKVDFWGMLEAYNVARGWDPTSGYPTAEKLSSLGLDFVIPDLYPSRTTQE